MVGDLEERLVEAALAWREEFWRQAPGFAGLEAREQVEEPFKEALQTWVAGLVPQEGPWEGRWFDGVLFDDLQFEGSQGIAIRGRIYEVVTQDTVPVEARLVLGPGPLLSAFEVRLGNAEHPRGVLPKTTRPSWAVREWMFRFARQ